MKLKLVRISNFRGIKFCEWKVPQRNLFCFIGSGDSSKTTILEAIQLCFYPHWNLQLNDTDFYNADVSNNIRIEITLGNLNDEFLDRASYGDYLRGWDAKNFKLQDEPGEELGDVLTFLLKVGDDLEPQWRVVNDRIGEDVEFKTSDRVRIRASFIGIHSDRHLTWGRGSVLSQLTDKQQSISSSSASAVRAAKSSLEDQRSSLSVFDETAVKAELVAKNLGVPVKNSYQSHLDFGSVNVRASSFSLHDGEIPLRRLGLGSKRMLTSGLQKEGLEENHITLIDELEIGLEPYRISRLIKFLKSDSSGQYFITTHSPVVLRELVLQDLFSVQATEGTIKINDLSAVEGANNLQGTLRRQSEAFLARKIIVCEGATEVGLCRGLDNHWNPLGFETYAFRGVSTYDAGGAKNIEERAINLKAAGYDVAVLADSDSPKNFSHTTCKTLEEKGIKVLCWSWDFAYSTEEAILSSIPWEYVLLSVIKAQENGKDTKGSIENSSGLDADPQKWLESDELRTRIAKAANKGKWFKSISLAEEWLGLISPKIYPNAASPSDLNDKLKSLREWIDHEYTS